MPKKPARKKRSSSKTKRGTSKKVQERKKKIKNVLTLSLLVAISSAFLSGFIVYKKLTQEFASAFSVSSRSLLSDELFASAFLVVDNFEADPVLVREISLYVFDKSTLKMIVYEIPVDVVIDVPGRFAEEPFSHILALGNLNGQNLDISSKLLSDSIFKLLAFPVDRYVLTERDGEVFARSLFEGKFIFSNEEEIWQLKDSVKTNHTLKEFYDIYKFSNSLPQDRILKKQIGRPYLENPRLVDEEFMDLTFDSILSREKKNVSVLNGSGKTGVASFGARVVKNLGGRVVAVSNTKEIHEESIIITDDLTAESMRILAQIFEIEQVILYSEARDFPESEISRSDITLIFGIDFAESL